MKTEVRKRLRKEIKEFMKENNLNWKNMQQHCIKKNLDFPVGWRTLYRFIRQNKDMSVTSQSKVFKYFKIVHSQSDYGVIEIKTEEHGADIQPQ